MSRTILDVHVVQTVPPSNLNRDDTGSPKTAIYGGVRRARASSQSWKRATRLAFATLLDTSELGTRTKRVVELLAERIRATSDVDEASAFDAARAAFAGAGIKLSDKKGGPAESGYLIFLSAQQIDALARAAVSSIETGEALSKKDLQAILKGKNSIDLALFGRMVADVSDLNVDAAVQVAHAISTHAVEQEYDYFTAVDDHKAADEEEDAGAGMIGTVEFNSSTLYRYATVDVDLLSQNLGSAKATIRAVQAFLSAFVRSMPTGKQTTFAHRTLPDAVVVSLRHDQTVSWVGAFEEPIPLSPAGGIAVASVKRLTEWAAELEESGFAEKPVRTWTAGVGRATESLGQVSSVQPFTEIVEAVAATVSDRLDADAP